MLPFQSKSSVVVQSKGESFQGHPRKEEAFVTIFAVNYMISPLNTEGELEGPANCYLDQENLEHISWIFRVWMESLLSCERCVGRKNDHLLVPQEGATGEESASFTLVINNPLANAGDVRCRFSP